MSATILAAWAVVTVTPLFASVVLAHTNDPTIAHPSRQLESAAVVRSLHPEPAWNAQTTRKLVQPFVAPAVNNPPFSTRQQYAGEWPAVSWDAQRRATLTQPFVQPVDSPPLSSRHSYSGEWPELSWDTQHRPPLVPGSEINTPLPLQHRYAGEWPALSWDTQQRAKLIPSASVAPVDAPPVHQPAAIYGPLASHYAPPTITPFWTSTVTVEGVAVGPVDDPPFQMRSRYDQPVEIHWIPRGLTAISIGRYAESVDNPPPLEPKYRGEWPAITWDTQRRPELVPIVPETVNDPPYGIKGDRVYPKYADHWEPPPYYQWHSVRVTEPAEEPPVMTGTTWRPIWGRRRRT